MPIDEIGVVLAAERAWIDLEGPPEINLGLAAPRGVDVEEASTKGRRSKRFLVQLGGLSLGPGGAEKDVRFNPGLSEEHVHDLGRPGGWAVFGGRRPMGLAEPLFLYRGGIEHVWRGDRGEWFQRTLAVGVTVGLVVDHSWASAPLMTTVLPHATFGSLRLPGGGELSIRVSAMPPPPPHAPPALGGRGFVLLSILFTPG